MFVSKPFKLIIFICVILLLCTHFVSPVSAATYTNVNSNRKVLNFNTNWLYNPSNVAGGQATNLNESGFTQVSLPHSNRVLTRHNALNLADYRFISWYRRHFSLPTTYNGRRIFVEFQSVGTVADVYVNGTLIGTHRGAYTSFTFEITNNVTFGSADNVIAVRVDSTQHNDIPPEGSRQDFLLFGGITRDVKMIVTDPLHVDWTFITSPTVSTSSAVINAKTNVRNQSSASKSVTVTTVVVDASNNVISSVSSTQSIAANASFQFNQNTPAISSPNLWTPDNPYLYKVYTQIQDGTTFVDEYVTRTGIRSISFNRTDGKFYLNGTAYKLRGLNRHETFPYIGRSAPNRLQRKDAEILKNELGVNIVRTSHYPQDPEFLDRADELGIFVMEEIPGWQFIGNSAWQAIAITNVQEMVMRDRNHPSIVTWGVRINESGDNDAFYTQTNAAARNLDPSRPTSGVRNGSGSTTHFLEDLWTFNDFNGSVGNPTGTLRSPGNLPELVTEYLGHTYPTWSYSPEPTLVRHMELHASVQDSSMGFSNISGAIGWAAFDYNTTADFCVSNVCNHGVSDIWRVAKHAAYVYKSQVDRAKIGPVIYIGNYWLSNSPTTVDVASNCDQVELFVNGVSRGVRSPNLYTRLPHPLTQYTGVTFQSGELKANCIAGGSVVASTSRRTPGSVSRLVLTPGSTTLLADGADMTMVIVTAVDANGTVVPYATNSVTFSVSGVGTFLGESPIALEGGRAGFFVRSRLDQTGTITATASASGVTSGSTTITVAAFTEERVPLPTGITPTSTGVPPTNTPLPVPTNTPVGTGVFSVDDSVQGTGMNQFNYVGTWGHGSGGTSNATCYNNSNSWSNVANNTVTITFSGSQIRFYGVKANNHGIGAISIDGGAETQFDLYAATRAGNVLIWTSPVLSLQGSHTLRIRVTGTKNAASSATHVAIDRVEILP